jgi:hypothetical protein
MKRVGLVTMASVIACASAAGFASAGSAQAAPDLGGGVGRWCPGQELPVSGYPPHPKVWQMDVCHDWYSIYNADNDTWSVVEGKPPFS